MRVAAQLNRDTLRVSIQKLVARQFDVDVEALPATTDIFTELSECGFDSLELTMSIEDAFDLEIPDTALAGLKTVDDVTDYMARRLGLTGDAPAALS